MSKKKKAITKPLSEIQKREQAANPPKSLSEITKPTLPKDTPEGTSIIFDSIEVDCWDELQNVTQRLKDSHIEWEAIYNMFDGLSVETIFFQLDVWKTAIGYVKFLILNKDSVVTDLEQLKHLGRIDVITILGILDHFTSEELIKNTLKDLRTSTARFLIFAPSIYNKKINKSEEEWKEVFKECGFVYNEILSREFNTKIKTHRPYYQIYATKVY